MAQNTSFARSFNAVKTNKSHSTILFQCDRVQRKIECKLFGHNCLECHNNNSTYYTADYNDKEIEDIIEFLRKALLRKLHPGISREERGGRGEFHHQSGPVQRYYNVDFATYCESCQRGDYCRLHGQKLI